LASLLPRGPNFFVSYQWTRNSSSVINAGLVPTEAEQAGNLAGLVNALGQPVTVYNPATGMPYSNNQVPVSPQAKALLQLYPLPNIADVSNYNYQAPVLNNTHQDSLQSKLDKTLGRKDQLYGAFNFQSTRASNVNLFGFVDQTGTLGVNGNIHWAHRLKPRIFLFTGYTFSRLRTEVTPNFENRVNISGAAGHWRQRSGCRRLGSAVARLLERLCRIERCQQRIQSQCHQLVSASTLIYRGKHNITIGGEFRKQQYNDFFQQNPRGAFGFTGAATGAAKARQEDRPAVPILRTFLSACPTPAPSPSAMRTSTFASRCTPRTSPTTGASAHPYHQCGNAVGLQRADDGTVWPAGQSRCRERLHRRGAGAGQRSGGSVTGGIIRLR
jgi:trimeric autotransporter adhesin